MSEALRDRIRKQQKEIEGLKDRLTDMGMHAEQVLILHRKLNDERSAVAELKHRLSLIGSERSIEDAIKEHSHSLFIKITAQKRKPTRRKK